MVDRDPEEDARPGTEWAQTLAEATPDAKAAACEAAIARLFPGCPNLDPAHNQGYTQQLKVLLNDAGEVAIAIDAPSFQIPHPNSSTGYRQLTTVMYLEHYGLPRDFWNTLSNARSCLSRMATRLGFDDHYDPENLRVTLGSPHGLEDLIAQLARMADVSGTDLNGPPVTRAARALL